MKIPKLDEKQKSFTYYTNGERTIKIKPNQEIPDGFYPGQHYKKEPWNKGLTADSDERVRNNTEKAHNTRKENNNYVAWNKGLTKDTDERVAKNYSGMVKTMKDKYGVENAGQLPHQVWNKGLTKDTDERMKQASENHKGVVAWNKGIHIEGHPHTEETKRHLSKVLSTDEVKLKRYNTLKQNGNLGLNTDTKPEIEYYQNLLKTYNPKDIIHPYSDERYPFKCDFYIIPEDKFVEIHAGWTHGGHPFDENSPKDIEKLNTWKERAKHSDYYKNAIYTWTDLDVRKVSVAKKNHLNFEVIY